MDHRAEAILHYEGAAEDTDPVSTARQCTSSLPCVVVNCPFSYFPAEANTSCVNVETLRSAEEMPVRLAVTIADFCCSSCSCCCCCFAKHITVWPLFHKTCIHPLQYTFRHLPTLLLLIFVCLFVFVFYMLKYSVSVGYSNTYL